MSAPPPKKLYSSLMFFVKVHVHRDMFYILNPPLGEMGETSNKDLYETTTGKPTEVQLKGGVFEFVSFPPHLSSMLFSPPQLMMLATLTRRWLPLR